MLKKTVAIATILTLGVVGLETAWSQTGTDPYGTTGTTTSQSGTATDPAATTTETTDPSMTSEESSLPETASPWPLFGLVGLGSLGAGLILRRRRP